MEVEVKQVLEVVTVEPETTMSRNRVMAKARGTQELKLAPEPGLNIS